MTRIVATSDFHGELPPIPECDLLLVGGDISPGGTLISEAKWLDREFRNWLETVPAKEIVGIAGNHDLLFERGEVLVPKNLKWHYLRDNWIQLFGFKIYGTPWQLPFWGAFNLPEERLVEIYRNIPKDIDILISHGPPFGILDTVGNQHAGSHALLNKLKELKPKLFICGHIHCSPGQYQLGNTLCANVCLVDDYLRVSNPPSIFEL